MTVPQPQTFSTKLRHDAGQVTLLLDASTHDMSPACRSAIGATHDCSAMIRRSAASQLKVGSALISFLT